MVHDSIRYFIRLLDDNEGGRDSVAAHRVQEDEREALPEVAAPQKWLFPFQDVSLLFRTATDSCFTVGGTNASKTKGSRNAFAFSRFSGVTQIAHPCNPGSYKLSCMLSANEFVN